MRLNQEERERVRSKAEAIRKAALAAGEEQDLIWDIDDLRLELRLTLGLFAGLFNAYADLLSREQTLFSPETAYLAGRASAREGVGRRDGYRAYLLRLAARPGTMRYYETLHMLGRWLSQLLYELGLERLLQLYTAEYQQVYGKIIEHTRDFFDMGYDLVVKQ